MDLSKLSPEDLQSIAEQLQAHGRVIGGLDANGRSPYFGNRVFKDLNVKPSATDPRPLFVWSADSPIEFDNVQHEFPKLMWSKDGTEITVRSSEQQEQHLAQGYVLLPPANAKPFDVASEQLAAMSDEDRALLIEANREARRNRVQALLSSLTEDEQRELGLLGTPEKKPKVKTA